MEKRKPENTGPIQCRWPPGFSGNRYGRRPGSKNRTTLAVQSLFQGEAEKLTRLCIQRALQGDQIALRLCIERILPPMKARPIQLTISPPDTIQDIVPAMGQIMRAVTGGNITPQEGSTLFEMLANVQKAFEVINIEQRLVALEEHVSKRGETG